MAMVLDALASYIQNMVMNMVKEKIHILLGDSSEINKMDVKLRDLKKFLADADKRNITDESVQGWVKDLKGAMYEATDIIDLCQLKGMKQGQGSNIVWFDTLLSCMRNPLHVHDIGSRLKSLNEKLDEISQRSTTFNFIHISSYEDYGRKEECNRKTTGEFDKLGLVGEKIEEDTRNLVELLTRKENIIDENKNIMVFAIVGVGGIGKTTLAQKIFDNDIIEKEFVKKIWLSVNQEYGVKELLRRTIEAGVGKQVVENTSMVMLVKTLKEALEGCKTLLVMDDVWDHKAWENVLKNPLTNALARGSRVLITTRDDRVAGGMMAEKPHHYVDKLEAEDAWCLLKKQVIRNKNDESQVDKLKDIGMGIVAKCDGLPLAVKVMGGLLCQKKISENDWKNVLKDPEWSVSPMLEELNYPIYLSYRDLHPFLKPCFLHFSLLPKSALFYSSDIVGMWISEGFIHEGSRDLEELGREYYNELMQRNLIEPDTSYVDQSVCSMHDVVRSFAQYLAKDEAFAAHSSNIDAINKPDSQFFRLSVETKESESHELEWLSLQKQISLRTLISVGPIKINSGDSLVNFSSIRTLHVQDTNFDELSQSLLQLKHLRYLSIEYTNTSTLPENIGRLKFLQYISLLGCKRLRKLPDSIGQLPHLRFLKLTDTYINNVPKNFHGLTNLRKLYGFPAQVKGDSCNLDELKPLSRLTCLHITGLENIISSPFSKDTSLLVNKVQLRYLELSCTSKHGDDVPLLEQQQIEEVFNCLCPPPSLESLKIRGYFGQRLPWWMKKKEIATLRNLRIVIMDDLPCCTELPDSLCQLPWLEFLQIRRAPEVNRVGPNFLQPHRHEPPSSLENLTGSAIKVQVIECPIVERIGNLPKTQELTIIKCPKLKVLEGLPALRRLMVGDYNMTALPGYLRDVNPAGHLLEIYCNLSLLTLIAIGKPGPEWVKFSHIKHVKAYADDDENNVPMKWYVVYTRDPFSFKTNIDRSTIVRAHMEYMQRLYSPFLITCPIHEEWVVGLADAAKRQPLCQRFRCNAYHHLVPWLQQACLHCCEAFNLVVSSDQWTEAAVYPAYRKFRLTAQQFAQKTSAAAAQLARVSAVEHVAAAHQQAQHVSTDANQIPVQDNGIQDEAPLAKGGGSGNETLGTLLKSGVAADGSSNKDMSSTDMVAMLSPETSVTGTFVRRSKRRASSTDMDSAMKRMAIKNLDAEGYFQWNELRTPLVLASKGNGSHVNEDHSMQDDPDCSYQGLCK